MERLEEGGLPKQTAKTAIKRLTSLGNQLLEST